MINASYDPLNPYYGDIMGGNLGFQSGTLDLEKAKQAWLQQYQEAEMMGMFNGTPTWAVDQGLGVSPTGQPLQTQQAMYGNSLGAAGGGAPTQNAINSGNSTMLEYLKLLGSLTGPQNAFRYANVLKGTPGGLADIVNAAAGRLRIPVSGGVNANTSQGTGATGIAPGGGLNVTGSPLAPAATGGSQNNVASPGGLIADMNAGSAAGPPSTAPLPLPGQIDPIAWQRFDPSQRQLLLADYQNQDRDPADVEAERTAALPQYRGAQRGGVTGLFSGSGYA